MELSSSNRPAQAGLICLSSDETVLGFIVTKATTVEDLAFSLIHADHDHEDGAAYWAASFGFQEPNATDSRTLANGEYWERIGNYWHMPGLNMDPACLDSSGGYCPCEDRYFESYARTIAASTDRSQKAGVL